MRPPRLRIDDGAAGRSESGAPADTAPAAPGVLVYRLEAEGHRQTGVVADVPVEDYRNGHVRRHEDVDPETERGLRESLAASWAEPTPVTLVHRPREGLRALLAEVAAGEPELRTTSDDGLTQTVWRVHAAETAHAICAELDAVGPLYIADGHHRMSAADHHAREHPDDEDAGHVLCALFPGDEMRVLGYHRCVARPAGAASRLREALARQPATEGLEEYAPRERPEPEPGRVSVWLDGRWYRLSLRAPAPGADARTRLDVVALEEGVLGPALGVADPHADARVTALPGNTGVEAMAAWCEEKGALGFRLHPPSMEQIMAVSDAGMLMPPKSTWFDPKAQAGPFVRDPV